MKLTRHCEIYYRAQAIASSLSQQSSAHFYVADALREKHPRLWREPCWVYSYYTNDTEPLYVGMSADPKWRDKWHLQRSLWRWKADRISVALFPSRDLAELAERKAIADLNPTENGRRMPYYEYEGTRDAWFIKAQRGLTGCFQADFDLDDSAWSLRPEVQDVA
jgi:hypothetical protein